MPELTTVQLHGTNGGYTRHLKDGTKPCLPCTDAHACYNAAYKIRTRKTKRLAVPVSVLRELLSGGDPAAVLTRTFGAKAITAIRHSGTAQAGVSHG